jgi:two-component system, OmpR family, KDP operon response regulator KdpE
MAIQQSILLIDDDIQIRRFLKLGLATSNFKVTEAKTGAAALALLAEQEFELIILDIGLPDRDGLEILGEVRKSSKIPIIVLSVRNDESGKVRAFNLGADDYITKPFGMAELLARIQTAIRHRFQSAGTQAVMSVGDLEIDLINYRVSRNGTEIQLTKTELALLRLFLEHRDKVLTHEFILRNIRGRYQLSDSQYLRVYIRALRNKIESTDTAAKLIHTIAGIGYRLVTPPAERTDGDKAKLF